MKRLHALMWFEAKLEKKLTVLALITSIALIAYCNSFTVPFVLDDFGSIVNNYSIQKIFDFTELWKFYSNRIVLYFTLSINYFIHDNGVEGYHITNLAIHIFNGFLIYLIMFNILGTAYFKKNALSKYRKTIAIIMAILFITHPIQVNAVTYIVQRTASLAATFYFLAIILFIKYRITNKLRYFLMMMLFIVIAMFTKENTITIPFMLLAIEFLFFFKKVKTPWYKWIAIFLVIFLTIVIIPGTNLVLKGYSQSDPGANFKASTGMDRFEYFYTELNVIVLYIKLMFIPDKQNFDYSNDFPISLTLMDNYSYASLALLLLIGVFMIYTMKRNRLVAFGILWFFVGLAVESTFISIKDVYFEHRLYFSCAGFAMFIIGMIFYRRSPKSHKKGHFLLRKPVLMLLIIAVVFTTVYTGLTIKRNYIYGDGIRLWTDVTERAPGSVRGHSVLATGFLNIYDEGKKNIEVLKLSENEYLKAIGIYYYDSTAHCNLSRVYLFMGDYEKCIFEAKKTLEMNKSEYADYNLGSAYKKQGKIKEALDAFLEGYNTEKRSTFILLALGDTYYEIKDFVNAKFYYEEYLKYSRSDNSEVRKKLEEIKKG